jgi:hypothetical protein
MAKKTPTSRNGCELEETSGPAPATETEEQQRPVAPVREKIGEARGNLRQRSDWFRKRSGEP